MRFSQSLHEFGEGLDWAPPVQGLARPVVEQIGHGIKRILVMHRQVCPFGHHLPQQSIGVLARAPLPRTVRIAEVHPDAGGAGQLTVACHLATLVVGQRLTSWLSDLVELGGECRQRRFGCRVRHLRQQHQARAVLDQHTYGRAIVGPLDQVAFPVPGMTRSVTSGGLTWMLTISGIRPRRSVPAERDLRVLRPWRR